MIPQSAAICLELTGPPPRLPASSRRTPSLPAARLPALPVSTPRFCSTDTVAHGAKVPAVLAGPQLNLTLSLGNCSIIEGEGKNRTLNCTHPHLSYAKARPAALGRALPWGWCYCVAAGCNQRACLR